MVASLRDDQAPHKFYRGGVIAYANEVKESVLQVPATILKEHGAVSEACATAMAKGAKTLMQTDFAIASTGILGPGGATCDKPIGTVFVGFASGEKAWAKELRLRAGRGRERLREEVCTRALLGAYRDLLTA